MISNRTSTLARLLVPLAIATGLLPGCRRGEQIGAITQYTRGGGPGGGGQSGIGGAGKTGVVSLKALFSGALIGPGAPQLGVMAPDDTARPLPTTPIVAIFSESLDATTLNSGTFTLRPANADSPLGSLPVVAVVGVDPGTDNRVAVLIPNQPLQLGTAYTIEVSSQVTDLEGLSVEGNGESSGGGIFGDLGGGGTTQTFQVFQPGFTQPSFGIIAMYPPPGDKNARRETPVRLYFNAPISESSLAGGVLVEVDNKPIAGDLELSIDPRIVQFTPDEPFDVGAQVSVRVLQTVSSEPIPNISSQGLSLAGGEFEESFRVNAVPTPKAIVLKDNAPVQIVGIPFDGSLTQNNAELFKTDVKVPSGKPNADSTTILFFQPKGAAGEAARAFTKKKGVGTVGFKVDLSLGDDSAAFVDSNDTLPPTPVLIGAFASRGDLRSPVGPVELKRVFVKTSEPDVAFGPPSDVESPYVFRTDLGDPAIYGTATEPIGSLRAVVNGQALASTFDTIAQLGPGGATDADNFFITTPAASAVPGGAIGPGPHFLPLTIDELAITDVLGNQKIVKAPEAGAIHYEGGVGGSLEALALEDVRVRVVKEHSLKPLKNADVRLDTFPFDVNNTPLQATTGLDGEVVFDDTSALGSALIVTASKDGCNVFSVAGFKNPAAAPETDPIGISMILGKADLAPVTLRVDTADDIPAHQAQQTAAFVASSTNGGRPDTSASPLIPDERFYVDDLTVGTSSFLTVPSSRPFITANSEHDGAGTYALHHGSILAIDADTTVTFNYADKGGTMDFAQSFANTVVQSSDITAAGITEDPFDVTVGRLVGALPGLPDVFPVSFSPTPLGLPGATRTLFAPIPPSLWINEVGPLPDPVYELLFQPSAASGFLPPGEALLEQTFLFELEAGETGTTRASRHRASLDFITPIEAKTSEPIRFPTVPVVAQQVGTNHPLVLTFSTAGGPHDFVEADAVVRIGMSRPGEDAVWTVIASAAGAGLTPGEFAFPDLALDPFDTQGDFTVTLEVLEFAPGSFDIGAFTLTDVERDHRRRSRSETQLFNTVP